MDKQIVYIKQSSNLFAKGLKQHTDSGEQLTTHPNSFRFYFPRKNAKGEWITGLTKEEAEHYGKILGEDLSPYSSFWENFLIQLILRREDIFFNLKNPLDYIKYKCSLANRFIAPSKDDLKEGLYHEEQCILYVDNPEEDLRKENEIAELKDEITSKIFLMKAQKEKMFLILAKTGKIVNETWGESLLYKMLRSYVEELGSNKEKLSELLKILDTDNYTLQVEYTVNKALTFSKKQIIKITNNQYVFGDKILGTKKSKVIEYFMKDEGMFQLLMEEMLED